jgi:hypothetical protein
MEVMWCSSQLSVSPDYIAKEIVRINLHLKYVMKNIHFISYNSVERNSRWSVPWLAILWLMLSSILTEHNGQVIIIPVSHLEG